MTYERVMGIDVIDDHGYQQYREAMLPILKSYGGSFGFDFKIAQTLLSKTEDHINRVFTIEFPNKERMEAFFQDKDYVVVQNSYFKSSVKSKTVISMHNKEV